MKIKPLVILLSLAANNAAVAQERAVNEQSILVSKLALLICNSAYDQAQNPGGGKSLSILANPCHDVDDVAAVLEQNGWIENKNFFVYKNQISKDLFGDMAAFKELYLRAEASGPVLGFIYYAGHGMQVGDETYLFGTEAKIDAQVSATAVINHRNQNLNPLPGSVQLLRQMIFQIGDSGNGSIFVVIDACRETPIDSYVKNSGDVKLKTDYFAAKHGTPKTVRGIKFLFSTAYGDLASDGVGGNSPFAELFVKSLRKTGSPEELTSRVIDEMLDKDEPHQVPDTTGYMRPPPPRYCLTICGDKQ